MTTTQETYGFTFVVQGIDDLTDEIVDAIYEASDGEATPSISNGVVLIHFDRAANSLEEAILSAIQNVKSSGIGITILRIDWDDLVSPVDIARKIGRSRQMVHQYIHGIRGPGGFPKPAGASMKVPFWNWREVAEWLANAGLIPDAGKVEAKTIETANIALKAAYQERIDGPFFKRMRQSVAVGEKAKIAPRVKPTGQRSGRSHQGP